MACAVQQVAYQLEQVSANLETVRQPNRHALYGITVIHDFGVHQNVPKPLAKMVAPLFPLDFWQLTFPPHF